MPCDQPISALRQASACRARDGTAPDRARARPHDAGEQREQQQAAVAALAIGVERFVGVHRTELVAVADGANGSARSAAR